MAPDSTNNSYLLEIDGSTCYTVGDSSSIPANAWTWVDYQNGTASSKINQTLTSGNHTVKMIGSEASVQIDRLIFTTDTTCTPTGTGDNCTTTSGGGGGTTPPYNNKLIVRPNGHAYYVEGNNAHSVINPPVRDCIGVRKGAGRDFFVSDAIVDSYTLSTPAYCPYEQEPGLNFVQEQSDPTVWLVHNDGTKQHVGKLCVVDPYTTVLKKFHVWTVPRGETVGHTQTNDYFGNPSICAQLPG